MTTMNSERGGVVSFIVVGLVLVGLLAGGVTLIKNRADKIANTPPETTQTAADTKQPASSTEESAPKATPQPATTTPAPTPDTASPVLGAEIASTGPTETLTATLVLGLLVFFAARYFQTRSSATQQ